MSDTRRHITPGWGPEHPHWTLGDMTKKYQARDRRDGFKATSRKAYSKADRQRWNKDAQREALLFGDLPERQPRVVGYKSWRRRPHPRGLCEFVPNWTGARVGDHVLANGRVVTIYSDLDLERQGRLPARWMRVGTALVRYN